MTETLVTAWQAARRALEAAGVEEPTFDARLLLEAGAGIKRADILTDPRRELSDAQVHAVAALIARRVQREPISHILGVKGFREIVLAVSREVLTPRPETELLVQLAINHLPPEAPARVLDLGVGSGAILAAILHERPQASGVGVDVSETALLMAQSNLEALGLDARATLRRGNWGEGIDERFNVIVANPPYIASADIDGLQPEVARYEPRIALDGGADGLAAYRALMPHLPDLLAPAGLAILEIGAGQEAPVRALIESAGLTPLHVHLDLSGIPRVWTAQA